MEFSFIALFYSVLLCLREEKYASILSSHLFIQIVASFPIFISLDILYEVNNPTVSQGISNNHVLNRLILLKTDR